MSALTSAAARSWSMVSSYGNDASISACHGVSARERVAAAPRRAPRTARAGRRRGPRPRVRTRCLARSHSVPPSLRELRPLPAGVARDAGDLLDRDEDPVARRRTRARGSRGPRPARRGGASARSARRRGRCGRRGRPASAARGCRAARPGGAPSGRRTRTVPNSSRSVTNGQPVRAAAEAAVEAATDERDGAGRRRPRSGGPTTATG